LLYFFVLLSIIILKEYLKNQKDKKIIDPWGMFDEKDFNESIQYILLGKGK